MRRYLAAWFVFVVSACFHPSYDHPACSAQGACPSGLTCTAGTCETTGIDASTDDAMLVDSTLDSPACSSVTYLSLNVMACPSAFVESITISTSTSVDTDTGTSNPPGLACAPLTSGSSPLCAIAASSITIASGATLSAHGKKPLALIGHLIDLQGTIDVASHASVPGAPGTGSQGPAADLSGCNAPTRAVGDGGGQGGTFSNAAGGQGGDGNSPTADRGGAPMPSISINTLRGGCPGGPNSDTSQQIGGHAGGAVWLAVDDQGTISVGDDATINASGAGGAGGLLGANRGGFGGGSGGMILFRAGTLRLASSAKIFADGGGGGGGSAALQGGPGGDPVMPGIGGAAGASDAADGGPGFPAAMRAGTSANGGTNGGGGGGGGAGTVLMDVRTLDGIANISPPQIRVN
jgi:hypothetical protein